MPIVKPQGLQGLKGLGNLSKQEYDSFVEKNKALISQHGYDPVYINNLYSNKQFIDRFGVDQFKAIPDINKRNELYKDAIVVEEFNKIYNPINSDGIRNNSKGLGSEWEKYNQMSTNSKLKLLESKYLTPSEFEKNWKKQVDAVSGKEVTKDGKVRFNPWVNMGGLHQAVGNSVAWGEASKQRAKDRNDRILEHIYNDEADTRAADLGNEVSSAYANPSIVGNSDEETLKLFKSAITPNIANGNLGIPEYASRYGIIEGEGVSSEMKDFTIDDMRQVLAKKAVYEHYMSPDMAFTALNNDAKRYIHGHQGGWKRGALFAKDVAIASTSYTMDKVNGFGNLGLMVADAIGEKPTVYVDDKGTILPLNDSRIVSTPQGKGYQDKEGVFHPVYAEQVARTTLYNMGKNVGVFDVAGSDNKSILNPQDWTRKEQFGVWDGNLAKQYEKLGSSPYKVAYNPNDDRDLAYESFKMMSFGLADAGAQLIPFGIGSFGKAMSTANYMGKVGRATGALVNTTSKFLTAETKAGQILQGTAGALGIAEAYQRGAFQETLAQNMANLESVALEKSRNEIYNQYHSDDEYKKAVDELVNARAVKMKAEYIASLGEDERKQLVDNNRFDEMLRAKAQEQVLAELVQQKVIETKGTQQYADMQDKAINSAGLAATNSFWPEAIKYGLVNTFGYRKFLYSNPTSVVQKAQRAFNGIKEVATNAGKKRLVTDLSRTLTNAEKWRALGKTTGGMFWGGAWTNGSDDMQVDAAERINEDSFNRYLHDYKTGESTADIYGFADGLFSYWMGLNNSLGQQTTTEAALVGGFGSLVSANLHFTNIASLATKEGRQAYKDNFLQRYKRDADGMLEKDASGNPIVEDIKLSENWRDRLSFFIQNGVLNEYYGKKQNLRDMQRHADYVNELLDNYEDFNIIQNLVASDIGRDNAANVGDEKTMRFIQAFNAIDALEGLAKDEKDPTTLSSVVNDRKTLIERATKLGTGEESDFTDDELSNLAAQYYSNNAIPQTEQNTELALRNIGQNARKMQEAYEAYNEAERYIRQMEEGIGSPIVSIVRTKMKLSLALDNHWRDRIKTMKDEIGDTSAEDTAPIGETLIATYGEKKAADSMIKAYNATEPLLISKVADAVDNVQKKLDIYNKAQEAFRNATTSEDSFAAQVILKQAKDAYDNAIEEKMFHEDNLTSFREKKQALEESLATWEKGDKSKVLSADEIMSLDPITRARVMNQDNRGLYNAKQQRQIEKLEGRLKKQDPNALQKIQDIALLTTRVNQNEDAYNRISRNPDAAAVQLEQQQEEAARFAVSIIDTRNASTMVEYINQMEQSLVGRKDISQKQKDDYVYKTLRNKSIKLLNIINDQQLLPQYQKQVVDAIEWGYVTSDIDAVINESDNTDEWKDNTNKNIDRVIDNASTRAEIMAALEKVIDDTDGTQAATDIETVLQGLEKLGYQRDATVIEERSNRREREAQAKKAREEAAKKAQEDAQIEAAKKAAEEQEKKKLEESQPKNNVSADGSNLQNPWDIAPIDQSEETAVQKGELSEPYDLTEESNVSKEQQNQETSVINNMESHIVDNGDTVQGQSSTIDKQVVTEGQKEQHISDEVTDVAVANVVGEQAIETSATTLSGNAMSKYKADVLREDGKLEHKKGNDSNDHMNKFYAWMNAAGIKLQNIIDTELADIFKRNPQAKIKFMSVRPQDNATHDGDVKSDLFLVLDYDNTVNKGITNIHNEENGGVIESKGKQYLIIGVVGYGNKNSDKLSLYDILYSNNPKSPNGYGLVKRGAGEFWRNNPTERFYVPEGLSTEYVPSSLIPGYKVNQLETDEEKEFRNISQLLEDRNRNPLGFDMKSLAWGIQEDTKFLVVGASLDDVMVPRNNIRNSGNAFVLIPASNGKLLPAYLKPLFYTEMNNGKLKDTIDNLLIDVVSPDYTTRYAAVNALSSIFYFDTKIGDSILLRKNKGEISLVHNGEIFKTFVLDSNFDRTQFMEAFAEMNPRVNITASVLQSPVLLQQYDEAGALQTDIAKLCTAGSSYSIYGVDADGNMIKPDVVKNEVTKASYNSDFRNENKTQVVYQHGYYTYDRNTNRYDKNGQTVTDEAVIKALEYNRLVVENNLQPILTEGMWNYYMFGSIEHPDIVKVNRNSKDVVKAVDKDVLERIKHKAQVQLNAEREQAAKDAMERAIKDGTASLSEEIVLTDEVEKEFIPAEKEIKREEEEKENVEQRVVEKSESKQSVTIPKKSSSINTQTFNTLVSSKAHRVEVIKTIKNKWPDAPTNIAQLTEFLRSKNIDVDTIGTSDTDVAAWIETLKNCR